MYKAGYLTFSDLKDLDLEQIKILASIEAEKACKLGAKFSDLKDLDLDRIKILASTEAEEACKLGATFSDLKGLDLEQIQTLISKEAVKARKLGYTISDLQNLHIKDIQKMISVSAREAYKVGMTWKDIMSFSMEQLDELTPWLWNRIATYGLKYYTLLDLKGLDTATINNLTSPEAQKAYAGWATAEWATFDITKKHAFALYKAFYKINKYAEAIPDYSGGGGTQADVALMGHDDPHLDGTY